MKKELTKLMEIILISSYKELEDNDLSIAKDIIEYKRLEKNKIYIYIYACFFIVIISLFVFFNINQHEKLTDEIYILLHIISMLVYLLSSTGLLLLKLEYDSTNNNIDKIIDKLRNKLKNKLDKK